MSSARAALPYVSALLASVLIGALIRWQLLQHLLHREIAYSSWLVTCIYGLMLAYALSLVLYLALLLWAYLPRLRRNAACLRRLLALLGALGSAEVIANLASLNLGIVRLGIASYALLLDGLLLYVSVNLSFFSGTGISITPCALSALMLTPPSSPGYRWEFCFRKRRSRMCASIRPTGSPGQSIISTSQHYPVTVLQHLRGIC
ncbi:hypothetical protein KBY75_01080 [Cyanobium sp. T1G-Tous]|uniref:hypothetical protein n=1 Tax=Cyanobium sp. T1G-Tous TaxID=2823722 RepID=UPI0020CF5137|nr:hypothetical protein [Cyanobium sp. T1G-Tous]MCP9802157.1 hypothetical protein [Cyanobium sp. T1G-Tous]